LRRRVGASFPTRFNKNAIKWTQHAARSPNAALLQLQARASPISCGGWLCQSDQAVVADKPTGKTIEDQRRAPWTLRYLVWDAKGEAGVQPAYGLLETPSSAIVYAVPEFICVG
jgi:hypothetical protein